MYSVEESDSDAEEDIENSEGEEDDEVLGKICGKRLIYVTDTI